MECFTSPLIHIHHSKMVLLNTSIDMLLTHFMYPLNSLKCAFKIFGECNSYSKVSYLILLIECHLLLSIIEFLPLFFFPMTHCFIRLLVFLALLVLHTILLKS